MKNYEDILNKCEAKISASVDRIGSKIPYIPDENSMYTVDMSQKDLSWWTNGFWSGILWLMYEKTKDEKYKKVAEEIEDKFDNLLLEKFEKLHHDVGFMWLHTAVANYRQTNNSLSKTRGIHAANILASRFNINGNFLVAWNEDRPGWMIVDSLMNIPILFWASEETKDPRFAAIALSHANTALDYIIRDDGSCNHICSFDPQTGEFIESLGGQGYGHGSSWTRGQSWVIYGMTIAYGYTKDKRFLAAAKKTANYFVTNIIENEYVSVVDFRAPSEPVIFDTTATAITASGLIDLAKYVNEQEGGKYLKIAKKMLNKLDDDFCNYDIAKDSILQKGTEKYFSDAICPEIAIIYGDFFYIEALMKLTKHKVKMW